MIPGTIPQRRQKAIEANASKLISVSQNTEKAAPLVEEQTKKATPLAEEQTKEAAPLAEEHIKKAAPLAEENSEKDSMNRREYFRRFVPSVGSLLVRGLRSVENTRRDFFGN